MVHERYYQTTGHYVLVADDGTESLIGVGFAGNDYRPDHNSTGIHGLNNPEEQFTRFIGPLPQGWYTKGQPIDHSELGPQAVPLTPDATNDMRGRGDFWIHPSSANPALKWQSSEGCICANTATRVAISNSGFTRLEVVA